MKIYEIGTGYTPIPAQMGAATEIVVEELTKAFLKQGVPVEIIDIAATNRAQTTLPIREVKVPKCFSGTDVQLGLMHKLKRVVYSIALTGELRKILIQTSEKVVLHFHNQYNLFFFLKLIPKKLRKKCTIAYTVHSYIWLGEWEEIKEIIQKRYFQEVYCVQNADHVLALNDKTVEHLVKHLDVKSERIQRIENGVNTDIYHVLDEKQNDAFKKSIGWSDKIILFQVGSVCDRKNQLGALELLSDYLQDHPDVIYAYAGGVIDTEYQSKIEKYAKENEISKQICYLGELCPGEQLNNYYNAASVTLFPSKIESFGLVIIESLSTGTPVILADKPQFNLKDGYAIYKTKAELAELIDDFVERKKKMVQLRNEVSQKYSWTEVAKAHQNIWENGTCET